jgi:hypothetical protein
VVENVCKNIFNSTQYIVVLFYNKNIRDYKNQSVRGNKEKKIKTGKKNKVENYCHLRISIL